jgi:ferredoxin
MALAPASTSAALGSRNSPVVGNKVKSSAGVARRQHSALVVRAAAVRIEFTPADGGETIVSTVEVASVLREVALGCGVELYGGMAKMLNCGGAGQCGTCAVRVTEGMELLSERTEAEDKKLKGKPADWRLACQSLIGGDDAPEGAVLKVTNKPKK